MCLRLHVMLAVGPLIPVVVLPAARKRRPAPHALEQALLGIPVYLGRIEKARLLSGWATSSHECHEAVRVTRLSMRMRTIPCTVIKLVEENSESYVE